MHNSLDARLQLTAPRHFAGRGPPPWHWIGGAALPWHWIGRADRRPALTDVMEPSPDEFRGFASVGEIAEWVQLEGDAAEPDTPRGNLFAALGVTETTHWRVVAAMPRDDYEAVVATLTYVLPHRAKRPAVRPGSRRLS